MRRLVEEIRAQRPLQRLGPQVRQSHQAVARALEHALELLDGADRLAVDRGDHVAGAQPLRVCGRGLVDDAHLRRVEPPQHAQAPHRRGHPQCVAVDLLLRRDHPIHALAVALDLQPQLLARRVRDPLAHVAPRAHVLTVDRHDAVALAQLGLVGRGAVDHRPDHRGRHRGGGQDQEVQEVEEDRQQQVGGRPRAQHEHTGPQRLGRQRPVGIRGGNPLAGRMPQQGHVPAQRDRGQAVLGLAHAKAQQRRPEADREPRRLHVDELGRQEVPQLMDEDERPDEQDEGPEVAHEPPA
jgi:hypothetical protein